MSRGSSADDVIRAAARASCAFSPLLTVPITHLARGGLRNRALDQPKHSGPPVCE